MGIFWDVSEIKKEFSKVKEIGYQWLGERFNLPLFLWVFPFLLFTAEHAPSFPWGSNAHQQHILVINSPPCTHHRSPKADRADLGLLTHLWRWGSLLTQRGNDLRKQRLSPRPDWQQGSRQTVCEKLSQGAYEFLPRLKGPVNTKPREKIIL